MGIKSYLIYTEDLDGHIYDAAKSTCVFDTAATRDRLRLLTQGILTIDSVDRYEEFRKSGNEEDIIIFTGRREVLDLAGDSVIKIFRNVIRERLGGTESAPPIPRGFVLKHTWDEFDIISNMGVTFETWVKADTEIGTDNITTN